VIQQEEGSAGDAHQHRSRKGSGAGSASEQQESSGLEHGGDLVDRYCITIQTDRARSASCCDDFSAVLLLLDLHSQHRSGCGHSLGTDLLHHSAKVPQQQLSGPVLASLDRSLNAAESHRLDS
jgi:hypothetical protein